MMFVVIGPSRSGKSTFINTMLGTAVAAVGQEDDYYSTTRDITNYKWHKSSPDAFRALGIDNEPMVLNFVDTIGLRDVLVNFTDEEISELVKAELMEKTPCDTINSILIFEDPLVPRMELVQTINQVLKMFGQSSKESIMVIITKIK